MPRLIPTPTVVPSAGTRPKRIEEFVGRVNTGTSALSIARMTSPPGWVEPGQKPAFDEYTLVLEGSLRVDSASGSLDVGAGHERGNFFRHLLFQYSRINLQALHSQ